MIKDMEGMDHVLEKLFESVPKVRILRLFMQNPDQLFSLQDVTKRCQIQSSSARSIINKLIKIDLIRLRNISMKIEQPEKTTKRKTSKRKKTTAKTRRLLVYYLNRNYPLLLELHGLVTKSFTMPRKRLQQDVKKVGSIKFVAISGVFIDNDRSRTDILIVGDKLDKRRLDAFLGKLESEIGRPLQYTTMETREFRYRLDMYDRFLRDILEFPHEKIIDRLNVAL